MSCHARTRSRRLRIASDPAIGMCSRVHVAGVTVRTELPISCTLRIHGTRQNASTDRRQTSSGKPWRLRAYLRICRRRRYGVGALIDRYVARSGGSDCRRSDSSTSRGRLRPAVHRQSVRVATVRRIGRGSRTRLRPGRTRRAGTDESGRACRRAPRWRTRCPSRSPTRTADAGRTGLPRGGEVASGGLGGRWGHVQGALACTVTFFSVPVKVNGGS